MRPAETASKDAAPYSDRTLRTVADARDRPAEEDDAPTTIEAGPRHG
jgi:hypothetical protein